MNQNNSRHPWTQIEDQILISLVKKYGAGNWILISQKMQTRANTNNRSGKQCRERWHNHLDPSIIKNEWSLQQQKIMFDAHKRYGNKWSQIANSFQGRTDNDIKNHFYSTIRKSLRRLSKMIGQKNSTQKIKIIKPSFLSKLFDFPEDQKSKQTSQVLFNFILQKENMNIKNISKKDRKFLQDLIDKITNMKQENLKHSPQQEKQQIKRESRSILKFDKQRLRSKPKRKYKNNQMNDQFYLMIEKDESIEKGQISQQNRKKNSIDRQELKKCSESSQRCKKTKKIRKIQKLKIESSSVQKIQKQNNKPDKKSTIKVQQIQVPMTRSSFKKNESILSRISDFQPSDYFQEKSLLNIFQNDKFTKQKSLKKQSSLDQQKNIFQIALDSLQNSRKSSSRFSQLFRIMSNNDQRNVYVSPRHPTPGFGENLFQTWNFQHNKITKQIIDQQTQYIKRQIQKNIQQKNE